MPKLFYTNSSTEYWRSVWRTGPYDSGGKQDLSLLDNVRTYNFAGTQHGPAPFPPSAPKSYVCTKPERLSVVPESPLVAMDRWITDDAAPPSSRYPTLGRGTLVQKEEFDFPAIPGVNSKTK
ncbi:MAG: hypothetical protein CM1200mP36_09180 [Gammaproteobacteria bacterium]|nr:MAG: hypothetical protein CM1200mP36_09180 [Gammaproteobacteria bacterium]